ncbi:MAG: ABC transporter permease [Phycisphaeraceae bacterium]|nr:ABC transporter permease [Phycisphaeraceae bacterium]MCW5754017.1 ABC transporter permease [Phycisphaeraceae bacterium]
MRPAWRLAISSASARRSRTALLVSAVALSAALIAAVSTALYSLNASVRLRTQVTLGLSDVRIEHSGSGRNLPEHLLDDARQWPGVRIAAGRLESSVGTLAVKAAVYARDAAGQMQLRERLFVSTGAQALGIDPQIEPQVRPLPLIAGRMPQREGEIVIDALLAYRLGFEYATSRLQRRGVEIIDPSRLKLRLQAPPAPLPRPDQQQADRFNSAQGVRIGDHIIIMPPVSSAARALAAAPSLLVGPNTLISSAHHIPGMASTLPRLLSSLRSPGGWRDQFDLIRQPTRLRVVGIAEQPPLGARPQFYMLLSELQRLTRRPGNISTIDIILGDGVNPERFADECREFLPAEYVIKSTERHTSRLEKNLQSSQLALLLASVLAFMSAAFIIMTGLTTDMAQRQRELAVVRCIGGRRRQLAETQIFTGLLVGGLGALIGVPLGIAAAWIIVQALPMSVPSGLIIPPAGIALAFFGSCASGVIGAAFPAWRAANVAPLAALKPHAVPATARGIGTIGMLGLLGAALHILWITLPKDGQVVAWGYVFFALPAMFIGYFLLGVPAVFLVARVLTAPLAWMLRLPRPLLVRGVRATPYRYGFTAGAMMTGLALMVAIWTNGRAVLRDWIGAMEFPDAFVSGLPLAPGALDIVRSLPFVEDACPITREFVEVDESAKLGLRSLQEYATTFIGFEPRPFFAMTNLTWVQGTLEEALPRLEQGGAVLIAREFHVARGLGVGDTFACIRNGARFEFEIVGVVTSPGLDIASRFFNIGEEYTHQAVHSVFGSLADMKSKFGSDQVHIIQINLTPDVDEAAALATFWELLGPFGLLDAGSARELKARIHELAFGTLLVFSSVAVVAMLVACFGVANLIAASIDLRRFEFGVLRAVGAHRGLITRMVVGEALMIAVAAAVLGTCMGVQGAFGGRRLYEALLGIQFSVRPPVMPIAAGWAFVILLTLAAAAPAAVRLNRRRPRELLAAGKG